MKYGKRYPDRDESDFREKLYTCPECGTRQKIQGGATQCCNARCCWEIELEESEGEQ